MRNWIMMRRQTKYLGNFLMIQEEVELFFDITNKFLSTFNFMWWCKKKCTD